MRWLGQTSIQWLTSGTLSVLKNIDATDSSSSSSSSNNSVIHSSRTMMSADEETSEPRRLVHPPILDLALPAEDVARVAKAAFTDPTSLTPMFAVKNYGFESLLAEVVTAARTANKLESYTGDDTCVSCELGVDGLGAPLAKQLRDAYRGLACECLPASPPPGHRHFFFFFFFFFFLHISINDSPPHSIFTFFVLHPHTHAYFIEIQFTLV